MTENVRESVGFADESDERDRDVVMPAEESARNEDSGVTNEMERARLARAQERMLPPDPSSDFPFDLFGVGFIVKQYIGVGTLNVETGRGELKVRPGDWILSAGDYKIVLPTAMFEQLAVAAGRDDIMPWDVWSQLQVLNNKSGPDKFTFPVEPLGGMRTDGGGPLPVMSKDVGSVAAVEVQRRREALLGEEDRAGLLVNKDGSVQSIDDLRLRAARGDLLTEQEKITLDREDRLRSVSFPLGETTFSSLEKTASTESSMSAEEQKRQAEKALAAEENRRRQAATNQTDALGSF